MKLMLLKDYLWNIYPQYICYARIFFYTAYKMQKSF